MGTYILLGNNFRVGAFFVREVLYILQVNLLTEGAALCSALKAEWNEAADVWEIDCKYNVTTIPDPGYYILQIDIDLCMFVFRKKIV